MLFRNRDIYIYIRPGRYIDTSWKTGVRMTSPHRFCNFQVGDISWVHDVSRCQTPAAKNRDSTTPNLHIGSAGSEFSAHARCFTAVFHSRSHIVSTYRECRFSEGWALSSLYACAISLSHIVCGRVPVFRTISSGRMRDFPVPYRWWNCAQRETETKKKRVAAFSWKNTTVTVFSLYWRL